MSSQRFAEFLANELSAFHVNYAGLVCVSRLCALHPPLSPVQVLLPLVPREAANVVLAAAAISVHGFHAAEMTKYHGEVSVAGVFLELQACYCAGTGRTGSVRERDVRDLLLTPLYCRAATGWTGSADKGNPGIWLPRALLLYDTAFAAAVAGVPLRARPLR